MQIRKQRTWYLYTIVFLVNCSLLVGFQSRASRPASEVRSLEDRVRSIGGSDDSWHIPDAVNSRVTAAGRQGLQSEPLTVYDTSGGFLGEVFQVRSHEGYVGLLVVANDRGRQRGLNSGFTDVEWPLDRVSREYTLNDLDNSLLEPKFYLQLDEDRLVLRVNLGKKELDLSSIHLSVGDFRRGVVRESTRALQR
jgi:hypothetical protein